MEITPYDVGPRDGLQNEPETLAIPALMRDSVMVTHEAARAAAIADRILFLADGRIARDIAGATQAEILETGNTIGSA